MRQQNVLDREENIKVDRKQVASILLDLNGFQVSFYESRAMRSERNWRKYPAGYVQGTQNFKRTLPTNTR